ncbi:unnamed protein product [Darwinula stevensoni]|uniref:CARD domain-containing protein n=1 Tax=Darwinula stevensoni TaxID=69355 RepID=A0A7R9ABY3_9CRUS|nr:unnamed protein product [Darwinula stevensoni]CAG0899666.1 unnamed protein product [Darwinula stevensoni]
MTEKKKEFTDNINLGELLDHLTMTDVIGVNHKNIWKGKTPEDQIDFLIEKISNEGRAGFKAMLQYLSQKEPAFAETLLVSLGKKNKELEEWIRNELKLAPKEDEESVASSARGTSSTSISPKKRKKDVASKGTSNSQMKGGPKKKRPAKGDVNSVNKQDDSRSSGRSGSITPMARIKRLKKILSDGSILIDMDDFLQELGEDDFIPMSLEQDIRKRDSYADKMNEVFAFLLRKKNPETTCKKLLNSLHAMERDDIIDRWEDRS